MGWTYMYSLGEHKTPKEYLDAQFSFTSDTRKVRVLDSAAKLGSYYAAVELVTATGERKVFAVVCLTQYRKSGFKDGMVFGYKDMEETMLPYYYDCPARILNLLTPTDNEHAIEWRKRCHLHATSRIPRLGDTFTLARPLHFTDGATLTKFQVVRNGLGKAYLSLENGNLYRISHIREREMTFTEMGERK